MICSSTAMTGRRNLLRMNSHSSVSSQSPMRLVPPIHRRHFGHLRLESSTNLSKHSRQRRWLHFNRTGSVTISMQMGQSRSSTVSDSKSQLRAGHWRAYLLPAKSRRELRGGPHYEQNPHTSIFGLWRSATSFLRHPFHG